jgi:Fe-S-cluster containining protein
LFLSALSRRSRRLCGEGQVRFNALPWGVDLVQIVDAAMAEAVRKGGAWIACKPGCCECCLGPFPITASDARRLRAGLLELEAADPERAARVRQRAEQTLTEMRDDDLCPALDPEQGTCDLYAARPLTCRTFGPAVRWNSDAVGVCELCFVGASDEEIAACTVTLNESEPEGEEEQTLVAFALTT